MSESAAKSAIGEAFTTFAAAMQAGDIDALSKLVADGFSLTHITGYVQPGHEWVAQMRQGKFVYYRINIRDLNIQIDRGHAHLVAQTFTDARVYGNRNEWRLQLALEYARLEDRWIAKRAVATLWN